MGSATNALELVVEVAVFTIRQGRLSVVATRREQFPHRGAWSLLSAPLQAGEDTDAVAERVLRTQAGAHSGRDTMFVEQLRTYSAPGRVPDRWVASVAYVALIADVGLSVGELGAVDTRVFAVDDLGVTVGENSPVEPPLSNSAGGSRGPASGTSAGISAGSSAGSFAATPQGTSHQESTRVLAFDHDVILGDAIERVRAKFEYTTVATSLVTEPFTVPELRRVYESVWGVNLHPANFRRKVLATPGFVVSSALSDGDGVEGGERRGPDLFRRGTAALLHPAMLRPAPSDE
jgi:8-oxo-dGTP diphosphatase